MTDAQRGILTVLVFAVVAVGLIFLGIRRRRTTWSTVCRFRERDLTNDEEFLRACEIPDDPFKIAVALASRRAIAKLGDVPPETIRANDTFARDLIDLPFWDSLDWMGFLLEVESECQLMTPRPKLRYGAIDSLNVRFSDLQVRHVVKAVALSVTQAANEGASS